MAAIVTGALPLSAGRIRSAPADRRTRSFASSASIAQRLPSWAGVQLAHARRHGVAFSVRADAEAEAMPEVSGMALQGFQKGSLGTATSQGTSRKQNEDRCDSAVVGSVSGTDPVAYIGMFDGHGGYATSEWLSKNMSEYIGDRWNASNAQASLTRAFIDADVDLLSPKKGFMGLGAVALIYPKDGQLWMATGNAGDARIVLCRGGQAIQVTEDHVPDNEDERMRIESFNPNPKMPLVKYVGGTWRVGGLLALSRAFGDAYMKPNLEFEGVDDGSSYSTGFGVIAEPFTQDFPLTSEDSFIIAASDGLFENYERGGGGGISNQDACDIVIKAGPGADLNKVCKELCQAAVGADSTDDITVTILRF